MLYAAATFSRMTGSATDAISVRRDNLAMRLP
jgi:hypothetical protein